jgi:polyribonucleotide 5'-hydroxyl-kinase
LTGYAVRGARAPVVVNLDSQEGVMSIPGTITATVFKSLVDVEEGWGCAPMSGPNGVIPVKLPLVYYYGMPNPEAKEGILYKALVSRMALAVTGRLQQDPEAKEAGVIIDTPGSLTSTKAGGANIGYNIIQHIVVEFSVTAIICLGSERLYNDIVKRFDNMPIASSNSATANQMTISVIKLAKSGGCVDRDEAFMKAFRAAQIKSYFYGNPKLSSGTSLGPRSQSVDFGQLSVYRLIGSHDDTDYGSGSSGHGHDEFLPGGLDNDDFYGSSTITSSQVPLPASQLFERVTSPQPAMRNCILAVLNCDGEAEPDELKNSSVMGFLYVVDVDEAKQRLVLLAPVAGRIPARAIVWGGWPEAVLGIEL